MKDFGFALKRPVGPNHGKNFPRNVKTLLLSFSCGHMIVSQGVTDVNYCRHHFPEMKKLQCRLEAELEQILLPTGFLLLVS